MASLDGSSAALFAAVAAVTLAAEAAVNASQAASTASLLCAEACASVGASGATAADTVRQADSPMPQASQATQATPPTAAEAAESEADSPLLLPSEPAAPPKAQTFSRARRQRRPEPVVTTGEAIPINSAGRSRWETNPDRNFYGSTKNNRDQQASNKAFPADTSIFDLMYNTPQQREEPENRLKLVGFLSVLVFAIVTLAILLIRA